MTSAAPSPPDPEEADPEEADVSQFLETLADLLAADIERSHP